MLNRIIFISAQPDSPYFHWQVEVYLNNFMKHNINPNNIEVLWMITGQESNELRALANKYAHVRFFMYESTIKNNFGYIPILRPDILEQHFIKYPDLSNETIFYHDSDIIFRQLPNFDSLVDDNVWYLSDTISYIGANYIKSKSKQLFVDMCNISGIDPKVVEQNEQNSGGAQYLMKNVNAEFWSIVKKDALELYKFMAQTETNERKTLSSEQLQKYNPIQKWCADMWAIYWAALKLNVKVKISNELSFSWGNSSLDDYNKHNIFHNAGVTSNQNGTLFYKADYIHKNPFIADFTKIDPQSASFKYVDAINYAKEQHHTSIVI